LVKTTSTIFHKSVQLIGYADDINIMGRIKRVISEAYGELKETAKEVGLIINVEKTKAMVQTRRLGKGRTLTIEDHKIEVVRRFKYLGTVINYVNNEMEEIRARILAANKAYSSLQTIFRSKQIHMPIWAAFLCGYPLLHPYFFPRKKRTMPRCSIAVHVFRGATIS
jgi:sorting nexin-29